MKKVIMTPELSEVIREFRLLNKISSKEVAAAIERSPSYVSKIESCGIKAIANDEFTQILNVIMPDCSSDQERFNRILEALTKKYGYEKREAEVFYSNLDTVIQQLPIPSSLVVEINHILVIAIHKVNLEALNTHL